MKHITWRQLFRSLKPSWPPHIFGKQKLLMAFEFGINISEVAKEMKIEVTPEMVKRAENILLEECRTNTAKHFACNMISYTLAVFEPNDI